MTVRGRTGRGRHPPTAQPIRLAIVCQPARIVDSRSAAGERSEYFGHRLAADQRHLITAPAWAPYRLMPI
jgi:hypothetical protein